MLLESEQMSEKFYFFPRSQPATTSYVPFPLSNLSLPLTLIFRKIKICSAKRLNVLGRRVEETQVAFLLKKSVKRGATSASHNL